MSENVDNNTNSNTDVDVEVAEQPETQVDRFTRRLDHTVPDFVR